MLLLCLVLRGIGAVVRAEWDCEAMVVEGEAPAVTLYPVSDCLGLVRRHRIAPNKVATPTEQGRPLAEDPSRTLANHRESERSVDRYSSQGLLFSATVSSCLAHLELVLPTQKGFIRDLGSFSHHILGREPRIWTQGLIRCITFCPIEYLKLSLLEISRSLES